MKRDVQVGVILGVIILAIIGVFLSTRTARIITPKITPTCTSLFIVFRPFEDYIEMKKTELNTHSSKRTSRAIDFITHSLFLCVFSYFPPSLNWEILSGQCLTCRIKSLPLKEHGTCNKYCRISTDDNTY